MSTHSLSELITIIANKQNQYSDEAIRLAKTELRALNPSLDELKQAQKSLDHSASKQETSKPIKFGLFKKISAIAMPGIDIVANLGQPEHSDRNYLKTRLKYNFIGFGVYFTLLILLWKFWPH